MSKTTTNTPPAIVWFRRDLRLADNPALAAAVATGAPVLALFLHDAAELEKSGEGGASRWWLHQALRDLGDQIKQLGGALHLKTTTDVESDLLELVREHNACGVFWNRRYEPHGVATDTAIKSALQKAGITAKSFGASLIHEPTDIANQSGKPFQVFTPFWKHCITHEVGQPLTMPDLKDKFANSPAQDIDDLALLPTIPWHEKLADHWNPTRQGGEERLAQFTENAAADYSDQRDIPSIDGTSKLSPWLHFGQISVREIIHQLRTAKVKDVEKSVIRQLYWRDFAHHLMFHFPHSITRSLKEEYDQFPWSADDELAERWRRGKTGYPIIDAALRQLWETGWMHNRVRMIVGSLLVKHMLQPWQTGAEWFADTLVDADLANNIMGWQWVAGSGADAAPYFRIFNPVTQAHRFDPDGDYVRKYLPELAKLPGKSIHEPWNLSKAELEKAGITLGKDYPFPIVDLAGGRKQALDAYEEFKNRKG
ncbi:cryptochrome/photolyase family protein [Sulfuriroseicoccus oceanibius]|uniref:Deoxyribodipyrimidine photo-lyase n=1 Tax=Sulfuriroseicoccus oceanibius TaxID=2707525 RepID=A0A6B3L9U8_9BACT|nr:deoxyribodipyrimidine photo-lyase [Sulfuriroseicoccus oceanibius]QQL46057.1 deoxyribodipyrimidine photo-lyase [Sulfuriroseicoccus oceanibius]